MDPVQQFKQERAERISSYSNDIELRNSAFNFMKESLRAQYSYNFTWMGRPLIQYPQDMMAIQEIIWSVKPDLIIETGIAHGGSLIFHASMLEAIGGEGMVLGIDIDIRAHNRVEIENHPMFKRIKMIEGSSIDEKIFGQAQEVARKHPKIMVILDSNHTHDHVLKELELYSPLVTSGSYIVVFDGIIETISESNSPERPWGPGNSPLTAIKCFLKDNQDFKPDLEIENKLLITAAPSGYLKRLTPE